MKGVGTFYLCGVCHRVRIVDALPAGWSKHTTAGPSTAHLCDECPQQRPAEVREFLDSMRLALAEVP